MSAWGVAVGGVVALGWGVETAVSVTSATFSVGVGGMVGKGEGVPVAVETAVGVGCSAGGVLPGRSIGVGLLFVANAADRQAVSKKMRQVRKRRVKPLLQLCW